MLAQLPPGQFPLTVDVAGEMGAYGSDPHYDFVLDQLLGGLRATIDGEGAGRRPLTRSHQRHWPHSRSRSPLVRRLVAWVAPSAVLRASAEIVGCRASS